MVSSIGSKLVTTLSDIINVMLDEDATNTYPYAVYRTQLSDVWAKGGVYKQTGKLYLSVYSTNYSDIKTKVGLIKAAIDNNMVCSQYRMVLTNDAASCEDGLWTWELEYNASEYATAAPAVETPTAPAESNNETETINE